MLRSFVIATLLISISVVVGASDSELDRINELEKKVQELQQQIATLKQHTESQEVAEIRRQVGILAEEIEKLRSGEEEMQLSESRQRSLGLGPSAASVYAKKQGVSLAGYGEMLYENFSGGDDQLDFLRAVLYIGYRFNDRFLFNSEIEFEHASTEHGGEASVEFAHVDYLMNDSTTLRAGMVLIPMGFINEWHEPTIFLGVRRPFTESFLIPSTWHENGFGVVGKRSLFDYRAYLVNGFNAAGFDAEEGLHEGVQGGAEAKLNTPSFVGRLDVTPKPGFTFGASFYGGNALSSNLKVRTVIFEGHAEYKMRGLQLRALYAQASLNNVAHLNEALGKTGEESIGNSLKGGYLQAGYNLFARRAEENSSLTPYVRFEMLNTQSDVPAGFLSDPANDRTIWTFGLEYHPIFNVVIKADYQAVTNEADTGLDQFNIGLGYSF